MPSNRDPQNVRGRLYDQIVRCIGELENDQIPVDLETRAKVVGTLIYRALTLLGKAEDDPGAGSAVRKYATAFKKADGTRGRAKRPLAGRFSEPDPADDDDEADDAAA